MRIIRIITVTLLTFFLATPVSAAESKPVVSVIVSGVSKEHARSVFREVKRFSKIVPVRNVYLLLSDAMEAEGYLYNEPISQVPTRTKKVDPYKESDPSYFVRVLRSMDLLTSEMKLDASVIKRLKVSYSPTWVVRYKGNDYIFEGHSSISRFFTRKGVFKEGL